MEREDGGTEENGDSSMNTGEEGQTQSDFMFMNLESIFKMFSNMDPNTILKQMLGQELKSIHNDVGRYIDLMLAPETISVDPWKILGVDRTDDQETVKRAYKKASNDAHPDKGGSEDKMTLINVAYEAVCKIKGWNK